MYVCMYVCMYAYIYIYIYMKPMVPSVRSEASYHGSGGRNGYRSGMLAAVTKWSDVLLERDMIML